MNRSNSGRPVGESGPSSRTSTVYKSRLAGVTEASLSRYLLPGERLIIATRIHPALLLGSVSLALVGLVAAGVLPAILGSGQTVELVIWLVWPIFLFYLLFRIVQWLDTYFMVTGERIILVRGLRRGVRKVTAVSLTKVTDISFRRSTMGRLFGYGEFIIESASRQPLSEVNYLPFPEQLYLDVTGLLFEEEVSDANANGPSEDVSSASQVIENSIETRNPSGGGASSGGSAPFEAAGPEIPPTRYLTGDLPERAPVGRRISLLVRITLAEPESVSAPLERLNVPAEGCDLTITVSAPALVPLGDLEQDLYVPAASDSEPIRFSFTTGRSGLHSVMVRAFAGGTFVGELTLQISVEVGTALEEGLSRTAALAGLAAEPGEVTLQVSRTDEDRYSFQLIAEALYPVELTKRLAGDPTEVVKALVDELRAMATRESSFRTPALVRNRIKNLGAQLWADAVPEAIRQQFWAQADRIKLFTVASDMDTVPWELLYPVDGDNDNGFLVEQFPVVRRVYGQGRVRRLPLASAAYIVPPRSPDNAMDEVAAVRARLGSGIHDRGVVERLDSLIALLDDPPNVLHFACHNQFTPHSGSVVTLDGGPLRPSDLAVAVQTHALATSSPLVFFNACRTAGEIPGLMQMMGWAKQFMGAGAGAFLGSLWAVRSNSARVFADAFYQALVIERTPLGAASLQARQAIAGDEGDPTWLAYTVYGNPSATVGDGAQA